MSATLSDTNWVPLENTKDYMLENLKMVPATKNQTILKIK